MNDKIDIEIPEDEDLARAKAWWKENGSSIIGGVLIGIVLVGGYNFWQSYQDKHARKVAELYEGYSQAPGSESALDNLLLEDSKVTYAHLARMQAAKLAFEGGDIDKAEALLNGLLDNKPDEGLRVVAVVRLATVYFAGGKLDAALDLLNANSAADMPLMQARVEELLGDIYQQKNDPDKARLHYETSIAGLVEIGQPPQLVQLKLENL